MLASRDSNGKGRYSRLEYQDTVTAKPVALANRLRWLILVGYCILTICLCGLSFWAGNRRDTVAQQLGALSDIILSVPVTQASRQQVRTNLDFQAAPPPDGSHEPVWDQLIPNGLGYVRHPTLAPEFSVVGVFHQLHCLYTIRRAYYAAYATSVGAAFDTSGVRKPPHIGHCFDYLQQSLTCSGDLGIEPFYAGHYPDIMFGRQCRDFEGIKAWAEQWRAVNGSGFIFDSSHHPRYHAT